MTTPTYSQKLLRLFLARCLFVFFGLCSIHAMGQNVNVNPGAGTYPTLKAAFDAVNAGTHTGAVTMDIVASTAEPVMAILNASGVGAASYSSVVITTSVGGVTVAGSDTATIKLAGADNVTIDGRIAGTGRNITVTNSKTALTGACAIWLTHGGYAANDSAGAQNNIIRNLEVSSGVAQNTTTTNTFGIMSGGTTLNSQGRNNDNNQYLENRVIKCRIGINLFGGSAANLNDNNLISGNIVGPASFGADQIGGTGIFVQFQNLCSITNNTVQFVGGDLANTTGGADRVGIALGANSWTSTSTTTTSGSNCTVSGNIIHDIIEERTFSAVGLLAGTTLSGPKTNNIIANNVIYNVRANSTPGDQCIGIGHSGGPGDKIVFNSISMTGDLDPTGTGSASTNPIAAGISKHLAAAADTAVFIKDNSILLDVNTNTTSLLKAAIIAPAAGYAYGSGGLDNNDYYIPTPGTNGNVTGIAGTGTVSYATLVLWQAVYTPAQDAVSIQANPTYNSGSFLKPIAGSPLVGAGSAVASVPLDIEGITRSGSTPTIGAYETTTAPPPPDAGILTAVVGAAGQVIGSGNTYNIVGTVRNFGSSTFSVCPVYYKVNGGSAVGPVSTVGPIAPAATENVTFSGANAFVPPSAGTYTIKVYSELPTDVIATNDTFTFVVNVIDPIAAYPYVERFTAPTNWTVLTENAVGTTAIWGLGICTNGFGKALDTAATANCYNASSGRIEVLRSPILNLTSLTNPVVHFYSAYKTFTGGENDSLDVVVSTDGGVTFFAASTVYKKHEQSTPSLATRPASSTSFFPDSAVQWRYETVSLANVAGMGNVIIGFRSSSDFGNRMWVDDVIVTDANNTCTNTFSTPGTYSCDAAVSIDMIDANAASSEMRTTRHDGQDPPYTLASPSVLTNATATSNNGAIFTPDYLGKIKWWSISYTGNDRTFTGPNGFTTFNISIDLTTLETITDLDSIYIVRRADVLDKWKALTTTRSGNILTASGVMLFGDFAIATTSSNASGCISPVIGACPSDITQCDNNIATWTDPSATGTPAPSVICSPASGSTFAAGTTSVMCTATNACGSDNCSFNVTINETPVIGACPSDITQCDNDIVTWTDPSATGTPAATVVCAPSSGSTFPWGTTLVTCTATNACGTDDCSFNVTINQSPVIGSCPSDITTCNAIVTFATPSATGDPAPTVGCTPASGSTFPVGTTLVTCTASNSCGNSSCTFNVIRSGGAPAGTVHFTSATTDACNGSVALMAVNTVAGASFYSWSAGGGTVLFSTNIGGPFVAGPFQTVTSSVYAQFGALNGGSSGYSVCAFGGNPCGNTNTICTWVRGVVSKPGPITGSIIGCPGSTGNPYSVAPVAGASIYNWTATAGITVISNGSQSTTVDFSAGFTSGVLSVTASLACGGSSTSAPRSINISRAPAIPGTISGSSYPCPNSLINAYSVAAVPGAASYTWSTSVPGAIVTGTTNTCNIEFPAVIPAGSSVSVVANSSCPFSSAVRSKGISSGIPNTPGAISGPATGQCGQTGVSYSISPVALATGYSWTTSCGTIVGPTNLSGVTVDWPASFTTCTLSVTATNACGAGNARTLVVKAIPSQPGVITPSPSVWCNGGFVNFSVVPVQGAFVYNWSCSNGTITAGQGSNNIDVTWGTGAGTVSVTAGNPCGVSGVRTQSFNTVCRQSQMNITAGAFNAEVYPNPASENATVKFTADAAAQYHLNMTDVLGQNVLSLDGAATEGINMVELNLGSVAKGVYMLSIMSNGNTEQLRVVVE